MPDALDLELARHGLVIVDTAVLRRVIKEHRKLHGAGVQIPHDHWYTLPRGDLETLPEAATIERSPEGPPQIVLVPAARAALTAGDPVAFLQLWRALFHSRVHHVLDTKLLGGELTVERLQERLVLLGRAEVAEARAVLEAEDLLLPPVDDASAYIELVAFYSELVVFAPETLHVTFPALAERRAEVDAVVALDIDVAALVAESRPLGAPERPYTPVVVPVVEDGERLEYADPSARTAAARARSKGNLSRAAILAARAGDLPTARLDLEALVTRLAEALQVPGVTPPVGLATTGWADALVPVAVMAATHRSLRFNTGVRLLQDLQISCVVAERESKIVDVVEWALTLGRRPVVRSLPATREVRVAKHLHAALGKLPKCEVATAEQRARLATALQAMVAVAEHNVRATLRPKLEEALDEVALHPHSVPERVAEKTLVDELLDRVVAVGRLTLGDLRDTLSHNDLKMHELELGELKRGDQLLRCDRHLDRSLDGVYRRGEVYLRALQKLSSVLFGTPVGRVITLYFMLPLLGSFAVLEGLQHMVGPLAHKLAGVHLHFASTRNLLGGAVILFGLLHVAPVRAAVWKVVRTIGRVVRWIAWDVPGTIWGARLVVRLRASWLGQWVFKPVIPTAIALLLTRHSPAKWIIAGSVFVLVVAITSTPWGRAVEERALDYAVRGGRHLRTRLLPAAVKWVLELFARGLDLLDRGIYRVDEWLRFRTGQSRVMLVVKGALGTIWFVITYFLRLYVDLFIEPTVNPVKHFPVVTVSAKLMIPFIPSLLGAVASATTPLFGATVARGFAGFTVLVIPGLAGFLVWELKENWKLYRETRPKTLRPFAIGTHGETMPGFLRPGFHSGTLPKTFARLRRATWRHDERAVAKQEEVLHHVEDAIARFANRQLVSMLAEVAAFRANDMTLLGVAVTSNRIQLTLACPSVGPAAATICFDFEDNLLIASIPEPGWLALLGSDQREIFEVALAGFYKLSDTDVVREQVAAARAAAVAAAEPVSDVLDERALTALARRHAVLSREPLFWSVWSTTWQHIARNEPPLPVLAGPSLLPD